MQTRKEQHNYVDEKISAETRGQRVNKALRQMLFDTNTKSFTVSGRSMEPFIRDGQEIEAVPFSGRLCKGKRYLFRKDSQLVIHRFVCISKKNAVFMGDSSFDIDITPIDSIIGESREPSFGFINSCISFVNLIYYYGGLHKKIFFGIIRKYIIGSLSRI